MFNKRLRIIHHIRDLSFIALFCLSSFPLFSQSSWQSLSGDDEIAQNPSSYTSVVTISRNDTIIPYVAFTESDTGKVKAYLNKKWVLIGGSVSSSRVSYLHLFKDHNNQLYISYVDRDNGNRLAIKTYNPGSDQWEPLNGDPNNLYVSTGSVLNTVSQLLSSHNHWMTFDSNNVPYVVYAEMGSGGNPYVKKFVNGNWQMVGSGAISTDKASGVGIACDSNHVPYIVYAAGTGSTGQITVYGYMNNNWVNLNVPPTLSNGRKTNGARHTAITIVHDSLYVIYMDANNRNVATVIGTDLNNISWFQAGNTLSSRDANYLNITHDTSGNLFTSFIDVISANSGRSVARVMELAEGSTTWNEIKDSSRSVGVDEPCQYPEIDIANNGDIYFTYIKADANGILTPHVVFYHFPTTVKTAVMVKDNGSTVTLSNASVSFTIDKSSATIINLTYNGINMLAGGYSGGKIYWSWNMPNYQNPSNCIYTLVSNPQTNGGNFAEVRFHMSWDGSPSTAAMDVDIYYALLNDTHGVYAAAELSHPANYPENPGGEWRMASYVGSIFDWLVVDSLRNLKMASPSDSTVPVEGAPQEVSLYKTGIYTNHYEDKYKYSADLGDLNAWGWVSTSQGVGIWITKPSGEYYNGGPMKRELTAHMGPTLLNMLNGQHYGMGNDGDIAAGENWKKVYGPFLIYFNSVPSGTADIPNTLWADAIAQAKKEQNQWPYSWFINPDYVPDSGRGTIVGKLVIQDSTDTAASAANMWVGVAIPPQSTAGIQDFQLWSKNYQFWVKTDSNGNFIIPHVLPGTYNIYAFGPGAAGEMRKTNFVTVTAGQTTNLGNVVWVPERTAPTVWAIGISDRNATEFRHGKDWWISDTFPSKNWAKFLDYPEEFPNDITYTIGKSDYHTDWNYVQPYDKSVQSQAPVWRVKFTLTKDPTPNTTAAIYVAYASAEDAASIVSVNGTNITNPPTGIYPPNPSDAMVREGIHGAFGDYRFTFPAKLLHAGDNEIDFTLRLTGGATRGGIMYDYIRLEAWGTEATTKKYQTITFDSIPPQHLGDPDLDPGAIATSGLPVTYTSSDTTVAVIINGKIHFKQEGTTIITASQAGDSTWLPAPDVSRILIVVKPRQRQTIYFPPIPTKYLGEPDFDPGATSSSGLPLIYTSNNPYVATIVNGKVHLVNVGPVTITAHQSGNDEYLPADSSQSFQVKALLQASYNKIITPNGDGINDELKIEHIEAYPNNRIQIFDYSGKLIYEKKNYQNNWDGRVNGKIVSNGSYYFVLWSNDEVKIKGTITVIH